MPGVAPGDGLVGDAEHGGDPAERRPAVQLQRMHQLAVEGVEAGGGDGGGGGTDGAGGAAEGPAGGGSPLGRSVGLPVAFHHSRLARVGLRRREPGGWENRRLGPHGGVGNTGRRRGAPRRQHERRIDHGERTGAGDRGGRPGDGHGRETGRWAGCRAGGRSDCGSGGETGWEVVAAGRHHPRQLPSAGRCDDREHRAAADSRRSGRLLHLAPVGDGHLRAGAGRAADGGRLGRGPLRTAPAVRGRTGVVRARLAGLRSGPGRGHPGRGPRRAGHRRGGDVRHQHPAADGRLSGPGPWCGVRCLGWHQRGRGRARPRTGRSAHRVRGLAGDLPGQSAADRRRGVDHPAPGPGVARRPRPVSNEVSDERGRDGPRRPYRLAGCGVLHGVRGRADIRADPRR